MKKTNITITTTDNKMVESLRNLADFIEENKNMSLEDMKCLGNDDYMAWIDDLGEIVDNREERTYFQPECYYDDGTNIGYNGLPDELSSNMAFPDQETCNEWLRDNGYNPGDFVTHEYSGDDIEDVVIIDEYGDKIE